MRSNAIPGFLPSTHGFRFANRWPPGPAFELVVGYLRLGVGEVADGLCGGMCFAAADRFVRGEPIPETAESPAPKTPLFREIARRQLDSFDRLVVAPARFIWATTRVARGSWSARDQVREWRRICADIDAGRPAMVGLVRAERLDLFGMTSNHQALAYAYEAGSAEGALRLYDPNHPGRDDVSITLQLGPDRQVTGAAKGPAVSLAQSTGEPLRALLSLPYRPARAR